MRYIALPLIIIVFLVTVPIPARASAPTDYVSCWDLEETSGTRVDATGVNDLTDVNSVGSATGINGTGADFESSLNHSLIKASPTGMVTGSSARSASIWFKLESLKAVDGYQTLINTGVQSVGDDEWTFIVWENGSGGEYLAIDRFGARHNSTELGLSTGTWYHAVVTWDGSTVRWYLNNVTKGTSSGGTYNTGSSANLRVGKRFADAGSVFDGVLDIAEYYNRALTTDEITELYNGGAGVGCEERSVAETPTTPRMIMQGDVILKGDLIITN